MKTSLGNEIRVRRRHRWVSLITFPQTEDQAELLAARREASIDKSKELDVIFTRPLCEVCEQPWAERTYSCPGSPPGE